MYRNSWNITATITPKMHVLEDHATRRKGGTFACVFMVNKVEKDFMPFLMHKHKYTLQLGTQHSNYC